MNAHAEDMHYVVVTREIETGDCPAGCNIPLEATVAYKVGLPLSVYDGPPGQIRTVEAEVTPIDTRVIPHHCEAQGPNRRARARVRYGYRRVGEDMDQAEDLD